MRRTTVIEGCIINFSGITCERNQICGLWINSFKGSIDIVLVGSCDLINTIVFILYRYSIDPFGIISADLSTCRGLYLDAKRIGLGKISSCKTWRINFNI